MRVGSAHVFRSWGAMAYGSPAARCDIGPTGNLGVGLGVGLGVAYGVAYGPFRPVPASMPATVPRGSKSLRHTRVADPQQPGLIPRGTPTRLRLHITGAFRAPQSHERRQLPRAARRATLDCRLEQAGVPTPVRRPPFVARTIAFAHGGLPFGLKSITPQSRASKPPSKVCTVLRLRCSGVAPRYRSHARASPSQKHR